MATPALKAHPDTLRTLPGDDVRQLMWRFAERYDLQMLVQSTRGVARGPVARLVAEGGRNEHEWTARKNELLAHYDASGITAAFMEPEEGGFIAGPKNLALALAAFELAWVDAGAATGALAGFLGLSPIHERGTPEQARHYMSLAAPARPGEDRRPWRAAFALTEPIPYVGVDTGMLSGKVSVAEWKDGEEPVLRVEKRGRFITNMGFANFVTAAVDTADPRIKSSCLVILEETDPGTFDRGTPTKKLVHQLSSTSDPIFSLRVPASRIVGGYTVKDGVIVPNFDHSEVIEAVFRRTRVTVGVMTSAKLLSAIEPVIRYQRGRFRGAEQAAPGSVRYELGIQQREDALHRLVEVWAAGEAGASLGFATARLFDELDPLEKKKDAALAAQGVSGMKATLKWLKALEQKGLELLELEAHPRGEKQEARIAELRADELVRFALLDAQANVLCPATKLWNTGVGASVMREAVSLMGGYGITEDCPGFLGQKWMDAQLEATYEGPEAVQRRQLSVTMANPLFLAQMKAWVRELRHVSGAHAGTGACALASAMELWLWTYRHLERSTDADGARLVQSPRQGVTFKLADALGWLMAARSQILDAVVLAEDGAPVLGEAHAGTARFFADLCHVQAARAAGEVGRICAELVHGYNRHPSWDAEGRAACWSASDAEALEGIIPGLAGCSADEIAEGGLPDKEGPCASCQGISDFRTLRVKIDGCLTGAMLAKDRAAEALSKVMIPEALDYPQ
ncbi:acyl-CoA dehydrogenase family protein [Anaeromyxobacter terrae]|uniref:acyl-CoA dehydrogenase family protein n=1 Tax=Anaeromyxobacter terrae TaxID=2925406 RepID=UPI001F5900C5|nr:acyl-CoA dehydrogenase family protein [Anaeromyxobacter sp. SG22]